MNPNLGFRGIARKASFLLFIIASGLAPELSAQAVKIMPLGDSITWGAQRAAHVPGGYRKSLGERLSAGGYVYDFVGSRSDNAAPGMDPHHNGTNGFRTDQVLANISNWLGVNPDIVLMKLGTNDMIQKVPMSTAVGNLNTLIERITSGAPQRKLFVSTIIPINETRDGYTTAQWAPIINTYNANVRSLVQQHAGQGKKVYLVDTHALVKYTDPDPNKNFFLPSDGTHPGQAGYNQMGGIWYDAIRANQGNPPPVTPTGPNLLANGSFESGTSGWTATGNHSVQSAAPYFATHGTRLVAFNAGNSAPNGSFTQTFTTSAGSTYKLTFDAGVFSYNTRSQVIQVTVAGSGQLLSQNISIAGSGNGTSRWAAQAFTFVANSSTTTLSFRDVSTVSDSLDLLLDNVVVNATSTGGGANTAPVANADSYSTEAGAPLSVPAPGVLENDDDAQGHTLSATLVNGPARGSITLNASGAFTYTPPAGFTGNESFTYRASDGTLSSNITTVSIAVAGGVSQSLVNGGFESNLNGWSASGNLEIKSADSYLAIQGSRLVAFNGGNSAPGGTLSQTFSTVPGRTYTLSFSIGVYGYNYNEQDLLVTVTGSGNLLSQTVDIRCIGGGDIDWESASFTFQANSSSTTLAFRDVSTNTNAVDLLLDDVEVTSP